MAVDGGRLIYAGESRLTGGPGEEEAAALRQAAADAGAVPLLYVAGTNTALKDDASHTAEVLMSAVDAGGYQGLFLDRRSWRALRKRTSPPWRSSCGSAWGSGCSM